MGRQQRELYDNAFSDGEGWSSWIRAVVLPQKVNDLRRFDLREPGLVSRYISRRNPFGDSGNSAHGLFEFEARASYRKKMVVFLGRPTMDRSLHQQILEHCFESRQRKLIDDALEYGYELYVRIKPLANAEQEEEEWQDILSEYDYAWNSQIRGPIREDVFLEQTQTYKRLMVIVHCLDIIARLLGWILLIILAFYLFNIVVTILYNAT